MKIIDTIRTRLSDFERERRIRLLWRDIKANMAARSFLQREADAHNAEARRLYELAKQEMAARSLSQLRRMAAREINAYRKSGDHVTADKLAAGYEMHFAELEEEAAGLGPKSVRVGDMIERDAAGIDRWKHSGNPLPDVFQTLPMATATKH